MANGRRRRGAVRREARSEQWYSQEEMTAIRQAAGRSGMAAGAFIAQAAVRAATPDGSQVKPALRGALAELSETAWRIRHAHRRLDEAAGHLAAVGVPDPGLKTAADDLLAYAGRFDDAALQLRRAL
jgi:hypothetical protein